MSFADRWLQKFISLVAASSEYRSRSADLAGRQPSCRVPFFVIYPGTKPGAHSATFFDDYSLTRAMEDFFGLGHLAHAADPQTVSLANHFGLVK